MTPELILVRASISNVAPADALTDVTDVLAEREEFSAPRRHAEERRSARAQPAVWIANAVEDGRRDNVGDEDSAHRRHAQRVCDPAFQLHGRFANGRRVDPRRLTAGEAGLRV